MKIAVLMDAPLRATLLSEKTMARLAEWGEVAVNETDKAEKETVKQIIAGADIAITSWGVPQLDKEILDCAPNLRFVAHAAGSVKGIVSDELYARGIRVVSSARILSYGVSETALGLTICACKNVFAFNEEIRNGGWVEDYSVITELFDITVGVVGCGFAGSHYIELLQAFGVNVLAYDPLLDEAAIAAMGAKKADLDTLLAESDVVSLHAPALDSTRHMINGRAFFDEGPSHPHQHRPGRPGRRGSACASAARRQAEICLPGCDGPRAACRGQPAARHPQLHHDAASGGPCQQRQAENRRARGRRDRTVPYRRDAGV